MSTSALLALVLGTIVPALTAALTKMRASPATKALLNAGLSAAAGALTGAFLSPPPDVAHWVQVLEAMLLAWVAAGAAFVAAWRPTGAAAAIERRTANFGVGSRSIRPETREVTQ